MKNYDMKNIRNIALMGASGAGKTSLVEQMFFNAKVTNRVGRVSDGNTVMDSDPDEIAKGISLVLGVGYLDWKNSRINIIDTPGYPDFVGDQISATTGAETAVIVANAAAGFEVGLENSFEVLETRNISKCLIVNKMDAEHADYDKTLETIHEQFGITCAPVFVPIGKEAGFKGIIDIIKGKAIINDTVTDIPADMADYVEEEKMKLTEAVAETDEELLEKYLENSELSQEDLTRGLKKGITAGTILPAFCCSGTGNIGVNAIIDAILEYLPSPEDKKEMPVLSDGKPSTLVCSPTGEVLGYIFKSIVDPNIGDVAYIRMYSGSIKSGMDVYIPEKDTKDKISSSYYFLGKNRSDASEIRAGEIGGLVKLKYAKGLNSVVSVNSKLAYPEVPLPTPVYWQAIKAVNQNDDEKIGTALNKLLNEDPTIYSTLNMETHENVISAVGEIQLSLIEKRLKNRFKVDIELKSPRIPYKETITGKSDVSYKHKKQSGGKGQYGDVYFRISPTPRGEGYKFVNSVVGGTIPSNFIPAIEKGVVETMEKGIIAGCQVVDICVDVYFGSYHDVDSSEMAFKIASAMALKDGFNKANPILLEPIHEVQIIIPGEYMGDVMGDISTRRGKIMGMEQKGKKQVLNAILPLAELFTYFTALKSLTQGRGKFVQKFSHFEKVPEEIAKNVIAAYKEKE